MFKCFSLPSFFFGFAVVNFGALDFMDSMIEEEQGDTSKVINLHERPRKRVKKQSKNEVINNETTNDINNVMIGGEEVHVQNEHIEKNQDDGEQKSGEAQEDDFRQLVLYYYIAVSFLLYAYKKVDPRTSIFSNLGDTQYKGPVDNDVFAVYKEFSGSDSKGMSTYHDYLSSFCNDALKEFLRGDEKISYRDAYVKLYAMVKEFLSQSEKIDIELVNDKWQDQSVQWAFTVALQVFAYKKIYDYLSKNISSLEVNNQDPALQHDLVYVKYMSEMLYNIFKNVLESFLSDGANTIRSRDLFFLRGLKPKDIGPENPENMFCSAFSSLVFRPALLDGSVRKFLDCFYPFIDRMKINK